MRLESVLSKTQILELYLNVIEWGPNIYGVREAARHYFGKHPSELTALESAFLVILIPNPKKYYRYFSRRELTRFAVSQMNSVLDRLQIVGALSPETRSTLHPNQLFAVDASSSEDEEEGPDEDQSAETTGQE